MGAAKPPVRVAAAALLAFAGLATPATGVEYRLQVASMHETVFSSFVSKPDELGAGASGPGLTRLETLLDSGEVGKGGLLFDRHLQLPADRLTRMLASARFLGEVQRGGEGKVLWDEVRWEGEPGGQSLWVIKPAGRRPQELARLALKGIGPLRHYEPAGITASGERLVAVRLPLSALVAEQDKQAFWAQHIRPAMDASAGLNAVVGVNDDRTHPDMVYLVVSHEPVPTVYKAVLVWRRVAEADVDIPGRKAPRRGR